MPKIPTAQTQTGRIPFAITADPEGIVRRGRQQAGLLEQGGQLAFAFAERRAKQISREQRDTAYAKYAVKVSELAQEVGKQDDIHGMGETFDQKSQDAIDEIAKPLNRRAREEFISDATRLRASQGASVRGAQYKRESAAGITTLNENLESVTEAILVSPNDIATQNLLILARQFIRDNEWVLEEDKEAGIERFLEGIDKRRVHRLFNLAESSDDQAEALEHLATVEELLDSPDGLQNLSDEDKTGLRDSLNRRRNNALREFFTDEVRAQAKSIRHLETMSDADAVDATTSELLDLGVISADKAIQWDSATDAFRDKQVSAHSGAESVKLAVRTGTSLSEHDRKDVDAYDEEIFVPSLEGLTPEEQRERTVEVYGAVDVIPTRIARGLARAANSDSPVLLAMAAQDFIALREASPQGMKGAESEIGKPGVVTLENVSESLLMGDTAENALEREREREKLYASELEGRRIKYDSLQEDKTDAEFLVSKEARFALEREGLFNDVDVQEFPPGFQVMFAKAVWRNYAIDPNIDRARDRGLRDVGRVWGMTNVGGVERLMRAAPEKMYQMPSEAIAHQLDVYLEAAGAEIPDGMRPILVSDNDTMTFIDPQTGELAPEYAVVLMSEDEFGHVSQGQLLDENMEQYRFAPDPHHYERAKRRADEYMARGDRESRLARNEKIKDFMEHMEQRAHDVVHQKREPLHKEYTPEERAANRAAMAQDIKEIVTIDERERAAVENVIFGAVEPLVDATVGTATVLRKLPRQMHEAAIHAAKNMNGFGRRHLRRPEEASAE